MKIIEIPAVEADRLLPLLQDLHALHAAHQPERHTPAPDSTGLAAWLQEWLREETIFALAAESPQGALLGYLIYELQNRPALPIRAAETRAMLHHISVTEAWCAFRSIRPVIPMTSGHSIRRIRPPSAVRLEA
ncbi:hypothetical protein [Leisingera sp. M523]|uniref:hypothetical protein n=1 Tax=Leisingera sp. M523 TaxID=2867013 RepID=UPI0021A437EF|nr:hypothetical protein [Leisingera sp. M523]